jgi:hypothetical protein
MKPTPRSQPIAKARAKRAARSPRRKVVVLSHGGGLDSTGLLLEAIDRGEQVDLCVFAAVCDATLEADGQDPGEWPSTYRFVREHVRELCELAGIEFVWLDTAASPIRGERSLFRYFERTSSMPARQSRLCTSAAKVERIQGYLAERFAGQLVELEVWVGFEAGEEGRAAKDPHAKGAGSLLGDVPLTNRFPLIEWAMCRCRCEAKVREWGLPVPRKSACTFCPFTTRGDFARLRDQLPETFARIAQLEEGCKLTRSGKTMRYGYQAGDGADPELDTWVDYGQRKAADGTWKGAARTQRRLQTLSPHTPKAMACDVCGAPQRATKATSCDYVQPAEFVTDAPAHEAA